MNIHPAQARDLEACLALDPSYETEYVWQMETTRGSGVVSTTFRTTRLPRSLRVPAAAEREMLLEHFERGECFLVGLEGDQVRGFIDATVDVWKKLGMINQLTVAPERRRKGIGTALLRAADDWARQEGLGGMLVEVPTKNYPGTALLQKLGYVFSGYNEKPFSTREISLFFSLNLR